MSDRFDGGNTSNSIVDDPFKQIPALDSTDIVDTLANAPSASSLLPLSSSFLPAISLNAEQINISKSKSKRKSGVNKIPTNIKAKVPISAESSYSFFGEIC